MGEFVFAEGAVSEHGGGDVGDGYEPGHFADASALKSAGVSFTVVAFVVSVGGPSHNFGEVCDFVEEGDGERGVVKNAISIDLAEVAFAGGPNSFGDE